MDANEKKAYVDETAERLKKAIGGKLAEIRAMVAAEAERMKKCDGADAVESVFCALDCTYDEIRCSLGSWRNRVGENAGNVPA